MDLHVTLAGRGDLTVRIYRQLFDAVTDGRIRPGERLPPTREMARRLSVSRNTVALAYERLAAEGVLEGRVGAGTFVTAVPGARPTVRRAPSGAAVTPRKVFRTLPAAWRGADPPPPFDFRAGNPDPQLFPYATWRRLVARELRPSAFRQTDYGDPAGHAGLRAAIARHVGVSRGVRADAEDVLVTQGAQQALDLVGRVLVEPGTCVALEEPGYPPARHLFHSLGARVVGVPVDGEGLVVSALPRAARLVYVTPSHQFPLGMPLSQARRAALLSWAEARGAIVIEDDFDSEFRFEGRPLDPLQNLDRGGRVVYVGSFSKVMLPALRLGFLIAPASLQPALRAAKWLADGHAPVPTQAALARFIDGALLARHIRKVSREYQARHARIVAALASDFRPWLRPVPSAAGLHVAAFAAPGVDVAAVVERAAARGVGIRTLSYFADRKGAPDGLVVGYGAIPTERVTEGLRRLAECFRGGVATPGRSRPTRRAPPIRRG
jgi:GntR family transcriptional regulator/MocR family aminotransferase